VVERAWLALDPVALQLLRILELVAEAVVVVLELTLAQQEHLAARVSSQSTGYRTMVRDPVGNSVCYSRSGCWVLLFT